MGLAKTKRTDRYWNVWVRWGKEIFVQEEINPPAAYHCGLIRALTGRAAARRFIRGNLDYDIAVRDWELHNPGNPRWELPMEFLEKKGNREQIKKMRRRQYGDFPKIVIVPPWTPEPDPGPSRKEWRRRGWAARKNHAVHTGKTKR